MNSVMDCAVGRVFLIVLSTKPTWPASNGSMRSGKKRKQLTEKFAKSRTSKMRRFVLCATAIPSIWIVYIVKIAAAMMHWISWGRRRSYLFW